MPFSAHHEKWQPTRRCARLEIMGIDFADVTSGVFRLNINDVTGFFFWRPPSSQAESGNCRLFRSKSRRPPVIIAFFVTLVCLQIFPLPVVLAGTVRVAGGGTRMQHPAYERRNQDSSGPVSEVTSSSSTGNRLSRQYLPRGLTGIVRCPAKAEPPQRMIIWVKDDRVLTLEDSSATDEYNSDDDEEGPSIEVNGGGRWKDPILSRESGTEQQLPEGDDFDDSLSSSTESDLLDRLSIDRNGLLLIEDVTWSDEGTYECTAYSPLDDRTDTHTIEVLVRDPAVFTTRPSTIYQRLVGQTVTMPCAADGDPQPDIHWIKVDGPFPSTTRTLQEEGNLTIVHLNAHDQGLYECVATNAVAQSVISAFLIVHPRSFSIPYNISVETTDKTATVSWLPAHNIHRHHHYLLWFKRQGGRNVRWHTLRIHSNDVPSVTVHDLRPDTLYRFTLMSRDDQNEAHFSDVVLARTQPPSTSGDPVHGHQWPTDDDDHEFATVSNELVPTDTTTTGLKTDGSDVASDANANPSDDVEDDDLISANNGTHPGRADQLRLFRPMPPLDVRAAHDVKDKVGGTIRVTWVSPPQDQIKVPIDHYVIEYRTISDWVQLPVKVNVPDASTLPGHKQAEEELNDTRGMLDEIQNGTVSFLWTDADPGFTYQFRVLSVSRESVESEPSETATLDLTRGPIAGESKQLTSTLIGGIVVGCLATCLLWVVIAIVGFKFCYQRLWKPKRRELAASSTTVSTSTYNHIVSPRPNNVAAAIAALDNFNSARVPIETPI